MITSSEEEIPSSLPDICIAYKLHLECGRLVNLFDWLQVRNDIPYVIFSKSKSSSIGPANCQVSFIFLDKINWFL